MISIGRSSVFYVALVAAALLACAVPSRAVESKQASSIRVLPPEPLEQKARPERTVPSVPGETGEADETSAEDLYTVGPGDKLTVELYNKVDKKEFDTEVAIDDTGVISLPQINKVKVLGLTTSQLTQILEKRYSEFMYDPVVIVKISEFNSRRVHVLGMVRNAGAISLRQNTIKLLEAIAAAGGFAEKASGMIRVIKADNDEEGLLINLSDISQRGQVELNIDLGPDDTIIALTNDAVVYVMGEVKHPKEYQWKPGMTLLEAIATAGGFTEDAAKGRTRIIREENGQRKSFKVKPAGKVPYVLKPGDVIKVPRRIF